MYPSFREFCLIVYLFSQIPTMSPCKKPEIATSKCGFKEHFYFFFCFPVVILLALCWYHFVSDVIEMWKILLDINGIKAFRCNFKFITPLENKK